MLTLRPDSAWWQAAGCAFLVLVAAGLSSIAVAADPDPEDPYLRDPDSVAATEAEMKPYTQRLRHTECQFEMVPIPGGVFVMGSPDDRKPDRGDDEGPQHPVRDRAVLDGQVRSHAGTSTTRGG